jgi:hypothetical protein
MKNKHYRLLTTLIVSALHPNEPHQAGTIYQPNNTNDIKEADELVQMGYAKEDVPGKDAEGKPEVVTLTRIQREDAAAAKQAKIDAGEGDEPGQVGGDDNDAKLKLILEGNVGQVTAELDGMSREDLERLAELEAGEGGKNRVGVNDAIADAIAAFDAE